MLPEQIWDYEDMPSEGLYLGRSAGSAQPLVWAHSEYLKLLRSAADGRVFDRISVVEERYARPAGERNFQSLMEVYQTTRPVTSLIAGMMLRVMDPSRFRVVYTFDSWSTSTTIDSHTVGYPGSYADILTTPEQSGAIQFTLFWPGENRWLGKNIEVRLVRP
jgi:glucoamylase